MKPSEIITTIHNEINRTTGCTDPGAISFAASRAAHFLDCEPEFIQVRLSGHLYKNALKVGIPGSNGMRGAAIAAAMGALLRHSDKKLDILESSTPDTLCMAQKLLEEKRVKVELLENTPDSLYMEIEMDAAGQKVKAVTVGDYSHIQSIEQNGKTVVKNAPYNGSAASGSIKGENLMNLLETVLKLPLDEIDFLNEMAEVNYQASLAGQTIDGGLGRGLSGIESVTVEPYATALKVQQAVAAAGEARMSGMKVPIFALSGSGNIGITNFCGTLSAAKSIGASAGSTTRALAIASIMTIYIKAHISRITTLCGSALAAGSGVAAASAYLWGAAIPAQLQAVQSFLGSLAGMVCDGAKESCAYKMNAAVGTAVQYAWLSTKSRTHVLPSMGLVGETAQETIEKLGMLNAPGMEMTERCILNLMVN